MVNVTKFGKWCYNHTKINISLIPKKKSRHYKTIITHNVLGAILTPKIYRVMEIKNCTAIERKDYLKLGSLCSLKSELSMASAIFDIEVSKRQ